jgi:hypothetical protein
MRHIEQLIVGFVDLVKASTIEVYNEFSLQHELGLFLRGALAGPLVQFERNVSFFFDRVAYFTKREIDISIYTNDPRHLSHAIELKFPRNGQHPEQMFSFCKDIVFCEELVAAGFAAATVLIFADDPLFYKGPSSGIYGFFRGGQRLHGLVRKPTGLKDVDVNVKGSYTLTWKPIFGSLMYTVVNVDNPVSVSAARSLAQDDMIRPGENR